MYDVIFFTPGETGSAMMNSTHISLLKGMSIRRRKKKKNAKSLFFTSRSAYVNLRYIAMLYTYSIGNQP